VLDDAPEGEIQWLRPRFPARTQFSIMAGFRAFPTSATSYTLLPLAYKEVSHPKWTFHLVALHTRQSSHNKPPSFSMNVEVSRRGSAPASIRELIRLRDLLESTRRQAYQKVFTKLKRSSTSQHKYSERKLAEMIGIRGGLQ
jgi:hypothetical protein